MDSSSRKMYSTFQVEVNVQYDDYFGPNAIYSTLTESTVNVVRSIYQAFNRDLVTGSTVTNFSIAPTISPLLAMKDYVQDITNVDMNEAAVKELEKWKNKDLDAFKWTHAVGILKQIKGDRDESEDEEEDLRGKLKNILHLENCKGIDSLRLPKADIVTSIWFLDAVSKDHNEYRRNLRNLCNVTKPGGFLLLYSCINCTYFKVGEQKYHYLKCDESFYRRAISEEGLVIKHFVKFDKVMSSDFMDHEAMVFIIACKM